MLVELLVTYGHVWVLLADLNLRERAGEALSKGRIVFGETLPSPNAMHLTGYSLATC
jgi:hypothetical protein